MANADTVQKRLSLINYTLPWRGPMVAKRDENYLGETHAHSGTRASLVTLYGGVMAITYGIGVDADSDNLVLGTLRSDAVSEGKQFYFVSFDDRMPVDELVTGTPTATSSNTAVALSSVTESAVAYSTNDGTVVAPIGRAVEFFVTLSKSAFASTRAPILIQYVTSGNNIRNVTVYLDIEFETV